MAPAAQWLFARGIASALVVAASFGGASAADAPVDRKGIAGYWAQHCDLPSGVGNTSYAFFQLPDRGGFYALSITYGGGKGTVSLSRMVFEPGGPMGVVKVRFVHPGGKISLTALRFDQNRFTPLDITEPNGEPYIQHGVVTRTGQAAPVFTRCAEGS